MAYLGRQPNTGVRSRYIFTATASQTTFSGTDDDGKTLKYEDAAYLDVFLNGVLLKPVTDYAATTKTSVVLTSAAAASDIVEIVAYDIANIADTVSKANGGTFDAGVTVNGDLTVDTDTLFVDATNNRVGIGTVSPSTTLHLSSAGTALRLQDTDTNAYAEISTSDQGALVLEADKGNGQASSTMLFKVDGSEVGRWDASGNLLVGTTDTTPYNNNSQNDGVVISGSGGWIGTSRNNNAPCLFNRTGNDGEIISVRKNGTTVGGIGTLNGDVYFSGTNKSLMLSGTSVLPRSNTGGAADATVNLGGASNRYNNIYASNGTINTSDAIQKQQIASLTDDEITAAKAISKLFKTYKWNSAVEAEGAAARTHAGVVAQEVEQAMTDAGLDATKYGFFCSDTWWEADETYTDDEGVEQTRTNTYQTAEEAPVGATERTRLGIRYPELLSFIGAATEQRLASIEARLATLENA